MSTVRFETPENILVTYRLAGPGTRFIAFLFDALIILFTFVLLGLATTVVVLVLQENIPESVIGIIAAVFAIIFGFSFIAYYGLFEWFGDGHTPGKRLASVRVVMDEGFSLTFTGVVIRNIFRVIDMIPIFWVVPVVTGKYQRFGDMVAGTIVISEQALPTAAVREAFALRRPEESQYSFGPESLARLRDVDVRALETFLERRQRLHPEHRGTVAGRLSRGLSNRLELAPPDGDVDRERFLEDLMAAYARREIRELG